MNDLEIVMIAAGITVAFIIVTQYFFYRHRVKMRKNYPIHWEEFQTCKKYNSYSELLEVGNKLIFNRNLTQPHLTIIYETAIELEKRFPEFKELRLNAYNKQLHYDRNWITLGSYGGIRQSWSDGNYFFSKKDKTN